LKRGERVEMLNILKSRKVRNTKIESWNLLKGLKILRPK